MSVCQLFETTELTNGNRWVAVCQDAATGSMASGSTAGSHTGSLGPAEPKAAKGNFIPVQPRPKQAKAKPKPNADLPKAGKNQKGSRQSMVSHSVNFRVGSIRVYSK